MEKNQKKLLGIMSLLLIVLIAMVALLSVQVMGLKKQAKGDVSSVSSNNECEIDIYLPEIYYAASGLTMEIYNSQVTNQGAHISQYDVLWDVPSCAPLQTPLPRRLSIRAAPPR